MSQNEPVGSTTREAIKKPLIRSGFFSNGVSGELEERKFSGEEFSDDRRRFVSFEARKTLPKKRYKSSDRSEFVFEKHL